MEHSVLNKENIKLNMKADTMEEAIRMAGQILVDRGYVEEGYIEKMLEREKLTSTYMGNYLAIPHGTEDAKDMIKSSGISILQIPEGVDYGDGHVVKLVIGIAGKNGEHLDILSKIAIVCSELENVEKLVGAQTKEEVLNLFEGME